MIRLVCLLSRSAGLECFKYLLEHHERYCIKAIYTHRYLPRSESVEMKERDEYKDYVALAGDCGIPIFSIDKVNQQCELLQFCNNTTLDLLISCSWRFKVSQQILSTIRYGGLNLHRGLLPDYKGAEPIKRALLDGRRTGGITAHQMIEEIDAGRILAIENYPLLKKKDETLEQSIERVKGEILPLYSIVLERAVKSLVELLK